MIPHLEMANGGSSELPQEVLAVLPSDPYEQLDVARKITAMAVSSRLSKLETESGKLRQKLTEKEQIVYSLQERVGELEQDLQETSSHLSQALDEQTRKMVLYDSITKRIIILTLLRHQHNSSNSRLLTKRPYKVLIYKKNICMTNNSIRHHGEHQSFAKLTSEKNTLAALVKKLTRDVAKLETFKRALMQSLQEDDETPTQSGSIEKLTASRLTSLGSSLSTNSSLSEADILRAHVQPQEYKTAGVGVGSARAVSLKYASMQGDEAHPESDVSKTIFSQAFSLTPPRLTPQLTPTGSPKKQSSASSPRQYSASGSPKQPYFSDVRSSFSSSQPTSKRSTASNSPPKDLFSATRTPRVDGKEFFRQARNRLSYEQFSAFLTNIKELNAHRQTREETLRKADEIFGSENKDLYESFNNLLNRHLPPQA